MAIMQQRTLDHRCVVCGRALADTREYGGRTFCRTHLAMFSDDVRPVWRSSVLTFLMMALLVAGVAGGQLVLHNSMAGTARILVGMVVSVVPALAWMLLIYRAGQRGRLALSPLLPTIFVLAALIAAAATRPVLFDLLQINVWLARTSASNRFLGNILIYGMLHAFILYAVVRYSVWQTVYFDHRADGVLYALAAGLGYAAALNVLYVLDQNGLTLLNGSLRLIGQTCAYLSSALIVGYFLGRNRFEDLPFYYMGAGVALAGAVGGLLLYAGNELDRIRLNLTSVGFSPWPGLVLSVVVLIATFAAVYGLFSRHNALTKARLEYTE